MTNQELFDKVVAHARAQKCRSYDPDNGNCLYRGPGGTKCFIGALIPDDKYDPKMDEDRLAAGADCVREAAGYEGLSATNLACQLQGIHDSRAVEVWEEQFQEVAKDFNLTYTPPHEHVV